MGSQPYIGNAIPIGYVKEWGQRSIGSHRPADIEAIPKRSKKKIRSLIDYVGTAKSRYGSVHNGISHNTIKLPCLNRGSLCGLYDELVREASRLK